MAGPFYNAIKGTTAGTPGTGAFTPNAAASGFLPWSGVPRWIGLVRFEDGAAWELRYCYWNGTTLTRPSNIVASSTGSALTLSASATATMIADANEVQPNLSSYPQRLLTPTVNGSTFGTQGMTVTALGTAAVGALATTNDLTEQVGIQQTSALTINAQAGWHNPNAFVLGSNAAGRGGYDMVGRFGATTLTTTAYRLFVGFTSVAIAASTVDPSTLTANMIGVGKDSADANLMFMTNNGTSAANKIDTGIAFVAGAPYEITLWAEPGNTLVGCLFINLASGAIYYGTTTTKMPTGFMQWAAITTKAVAATVATVLRGIIFGIRTGI